MKIYVIMEFIEGEGWHFDSAYEMKKDAENRIRQLLEEGISEDNIHLFADIGWKVRLKNKEVKSYTKGRWDGKGED